MFWSIFGVVSCTLMYFTIFLFNEQSTSGSKAKEDLAAAMGAIQVLLSCNVVFLKIPILSLLDYHSLWCSLLFIFRDIEV